MVKVFSPELVNRDDPEINNGYDLICFQLALTLDALRRVRPNATFTKSDLANYYSLQHGGWRHHIDSTINGLLYHYWDGMERTRSLKESLPGMLTNRTNDALVAHIMLGATEHAQHVELDDEVDKWMTAVEGESPHYEESKSLQPRADRDLELQYMRRIALHLGGAATSRRAQNPAQYVDVVALTEKATEISRTILVVSRRNPHHVEQVRIV